MRLYIADDDPAFARMCATVAARDGWDVTTCSGGRALVDALRAETGPAFLLIDIRMPDLDGIEVIDELETVDRPLRMRFMTGGPDSSALAARMIAKARSFDVGGHLMKPFELAVLQTILAEEAAHLRAME